MGRRSILLSDPDRWVFNRLAPHYPARPPYPASLADRLAELAGGPRARVADLGAGTGDLAVPLAARGLAVAAVEPARAMLDLLAARAAGATPPRPVHAAAEATGLPDAGYELVLLADAVQWVDPELTGREAARLLAPGGVAAVVEAAFAATPFMAGLAELLARANPKARRRPSGAARQLLGLAAPGAAVAEERFLQDAALDDAALSPLVQALSFAGPALAPAALEALVAAVRALAVAAGGARFRRDLTLRWVRRSSGARPGR